MNPTRTAPSLERIPPVPRGRLTTWPTHKAKARATKRGTRHR